MAVALGAGAGKGADLALALGDLHVSFRERPGQIGEDLVHVAVALGAGAGKGADLALALGDLHVSFRERPGQSSDVRVAFRDLGVAFCEVPRQLFDVTVAIGERFGQCAELLLPPVQLLPRSSQFARRRQPHRHGAIEGRHCVVQRRPDPVQLGRIRLPLVPAGPAIEDLEARPEPGGEARVPEHAVRRRCGGDAGPDERKASISTSASLMRRGHETPSVSASRSTTACGSESNCS